MKERVQMKKNMNRIWSIWFVLILYGLISIIDIQYPGLYMDSVNPDYIALHINNLTSVPAWIYPDNIIETLITGESYHYPILNSLYGINIPAYIFLVFGKVFGYSLYSLRILHNIYGIIILYLFYRLVLNLTENNKNISLLSTILFGFNTTIVLIWRTQFYLQLFPLITFIPALIISFNEIKNIVNSKSYSIKKIFIANILFGISAAEYFVFAIYYISILILFFWVYLEGKIKLNNIFKNNIIPFILGYMPFIYAHISIILNIGINGWMNNLNAMKSAYNIGENQENRFFYVIQMLKKILSGNNISYTIFGENIYQFTATLYFILFLISFLGIAIYILYYKKKNEDIYKLVCLEFICVLHFILGIVIGDSLGYQHYIMLFPIIFCIIISFIKILIDKWTGKVLNKLIYMFCIFLIFTNSYGVLKQYKLLNDIKGINFYSNNINIVGEYINTLPNNSVIICPQWGYWMGISIITAGEKEIWNDMDVNEIVRKINLSNNNNFYLLLSNDENKSIIDEITYKTNLNKTQNIINFYDDNDKIQCQLILLEKKE